MVTRSIVFALSLLLIASARADLQFTPKESSYDLEGVKFQQLAFSDGSAKEITYQHPTGWNYSGSSAKLTLHPPNKGQAEGTITKVVLPKPGAFDDENLIARPFEPRERDDPEDREHDVRRPGSQPDRYLLLLGQPDQAQEREIVAKEREE